MGGINGYYQLHVLHS